MDGRQIQTQVVDRSGQRIGAYHIVRSLESHLFSECYLAEHNDQAEQALIELFPLPLTEKQEQHFLRETASLQQLDHPHILRLQSASVAEQPYLVLAPGEYTTLRQVYASCSTCDITHLLPYLQQIASALEYVHAWKVAHKNICPESILLHRDDKILLCDFRLEAIAQAMSEQDYQRACEISGRVAYMAPEQFVGQGDCASDIYALGIMVYEWLTGTLPFDGSYSELAEHHRQAALPVVLPEGRPVPVAIEHIISQALAHDPTERYASAMAFVEALAEADRETSNHGFSSVHDFPLSSSSFVEPPPETPAITTHSVSDAVSVFAPATPLLASPVPTSLAATLAPTDQATQVQPNKKVVHGTGQRQEEVSSGRRAFMVSLVGLAALGGSGAWLFSQRLAPPRTDVVLSAPDNGGSPVRSQSATLLVYRGHTERVNALSWSPDNRWIATASDDHVVLIFNSATGALFRAYRGHTAEVTTVSWSPDGKWVASGGADKTVHVWEAATGHVLRIYRGHLLRVNAVDWSGDSILLASASDDYTVHVWNVQNGEVAMIYQGHTNKVNSVAWSPDNTRIASGAWDHTLQVWATVPSQAFAIGDTVFTYRGHSAEVYGVAWSPDGLSVASAGGDNVVQTCSGINGSATRFPTRKHDSVVYGVVWSPDGKQIATASADKTVKLWDSHTGRQTFIYREHTDSVFAVAWSPDGKRLASASADTTARVWRTY